MAVLLGEREPCHVSMKLCKLVQVEKLLMQLGCAVWDFSMAGSCRPAEGSGVDGPGVQKGWEGVAV